MSTIHKPTERVIDILKCVANSEKGCTLTSITNTTGISKGTAFPILSTLTDYGFLYKSPQSNLYTIGAECFSTGYSFLNNIDIFDVITDTMDEIVHECSEICQLGTFQNGEVLYIAKSEPYRAIKLMSNVGRSLPAYASALGKCLLSSLSDEEIKELYSTGLKPLTQNTITDINSLLEQIDNVRINNYAFEKGESSPDIECIAVPLKCHDHIFASISISIPIYRSSARKIKKMLALLLDQKENLENFINTSGVDVTLTSIIH